MTKSSIDIPNQLRSTRESTMSSSIPKASNSPAPPRGRRSEVPSPSSTSPFSISSLPQQASVVPSQQPLMPGKAYCRHCQIICDSSNRSRHERGCKQNDGIKDRRRIACLYPGCTSTFNRRDNLLQHQRAKEHLAVRNVELKFSLTPKPGSPMWNMAMQSLGEQHGRREVEQQGEDFWMDIDGNGT